MKQCYALYVFLYSYNALYWRKKRSQWLFHHRYMIPFSKRTWCWDLIWLLQGKSQVIFIYSVENCFPSYCWERSWTPHHIKAWGYHKLDEITHVFYRLTHRWVSGPAMSNEVGTSAYVSLISLLSKCNSYFSRATKVARYKHNCLDMVLNKPESILKLCKCVVLGQYHSKNGWVNLGMTTIHILSMQSLM